MGKIVLLFARPTARHANTLMEHAVVKLVGWDLTIAQVRVVI